MANKRYVYWGTVGLGLALGIGLVSMEAGRRPTEGGKAAGSTDLQVDPFWPSRCRITG